MKKHLLLIALIFIAQQIFAHSSLISEVVYIETPLDTDNDGKRDLIYTKITRPSSSERLPSILEMSPYAEGGNQVTFHDVDMELLPQDKKIFLESFDYSKKEIVKRSIRAPIQGKTFKYAKISAHSLGTGQSKGCPSVGGKEEALAGKAVIDWLNGRTRAFYSNGKPATADWSSGNVGMIGVSYDGTLPIMVASTGVEGLKAIVPIAAISNWYDYYRANGLVVAPGGYQGEDADVLGYYIVRKESYCRGAIAQFERQMGRESGDYSPFWRERNYLSSRSNFKAATFIIHGQSDWNVKQSHATQLWHFLGESVPKRIHFHKGAHIYPRAHNIRAKINDWMEYFLSGVDNGITNGPQVEVELRNGKLLTQKKWPHEATRRRRFYFSEQGSLVGDYSSKGSKEIKMIHDVGNKKTLSELVRNPTEETGERLVFLSPVLSGERLISGSSFASLSVSVFNRRATNITVALVEYFSRGSSRIITRGWVDPQNYQGIEGGKLLNPGEYYNVSFKLEPKQYLLSKGSRLGVVFAATDYRYTLRPKAGTSIGLKLGRSSFIDLWISSKR